MARKRFCHLRDFVQICLRSKWATRLDQSVIALQVRDHPLPIKVMLSTNLRSAIRSDSTAAAFIQSG
jgi:hypothetical protein